MCLSACSDVIGIVVSYQPDLELLDELVSAILPQVVSVVIVDNGSTIDMVKWKNRHEERLSVIQLGVNKGIAAAQNVGIDVARKKGARYVVMFDQDSLPESDMIDQLFMVAESKAAAGCAVASVGPRYLDDRQHNPPPFIKVNGLRVDRQLCSNPDTIVEVDYLISSGCLIPMSTLSIVGGMREELFIDYVDIEWGLRAKHMGFQSFGVCAAKMRHCLGDEPILFLGRTYPLHSAQRHYYHFRNAIWLYQKPWLPLQWKLADGYRLVLKFVFYSIFARPRGSHFRMMTLGIYHGLRRRMGSLATASI